MNALVVLNFNAYVHPKSAASFKAAADRWNCQYVEVTEPFVFAGKAVHPWWQKALLPFEPAVGGAFERLAVLDGDMLVREDCPSLFDQVAQGTIGAVSRDQPAHRRTRPVDPHVRLWARRLGASAPRHIPCLNGGLLVYEPILHGPYLKAWRDTGRKTRWSIRGGGDQGAISVLLHTMGAPMTWLHWRFNTVKAGGQRPQAPLGRMLTYIYHFNGPSRRFRIARCRWRLGDSP